MYMLDIVRIYLLYFLFPFEENKLQTTMKLHLGTSIMKNRLEGKRMSCEYRELSQDLEL